MDKETILVIGEIVAFVMAAWGIATLLSRKAGDWAKNPHTGLIWIIGAGALLAIGGAVCGSIAAAIAGGFIALTAAVILISIQARAK